MPVLPGLLDRERERVDRVGLRRVRAVGEVEDADVHAGVVRVLDDPVDRRDHLRDVGAAVGRGDLDADDARVRGHAAVGRRGRVGVGRGQRRVAPAIRPAMNVPWPYVSRSRQVRRLRLEREVGAVDDLVRRAEALDRGRRRCRSARRRRPCRCSRRSTSPSRPCSRGAGDGVRVRGGVVTQRPSWRLRTRRSERPPPRDEQPRLREPLARALPIGPSVRVAFPSSPRRSGPQVWRTNVLPVRPSSEVAGAALVPRKGWSARCSVQLSPLPRVTPIPSYRACRAGDDCSPRRPSNR